MFVNTNVAALNAWQNLLNTQNSMTTTMQQLSSGYKINNAADNPAGLAIAQQMQSQIDGMNQAYQNAQTGSSMLQTTDGALSQIQNILQSMYSLATQAANSTNVGVDRGSIQSQMNQYTQEINSITNQTAFNNKNLLDGVLGQVNLAVGADPNQALQFQLGAVDAVSLGVAGQQPLDALFTPSGTTTAASAGISGLQLFGASSTSNPYGSYGLTGTSYGIEVLSAQQAAAAVNGATQASLLSSTGTAVSATQTFTATTTAVSAGAAGAVTLGSTSSALTYTGTTSQTIQLQIQETATFGSASTTPTSTSYSLLYSVNGGSTQTIALGSALPTTGTQAVGSTGLTVNWSGVSFNSITETTAATATATQTDTFNTSLTPSSAQVQLVDNNGNAIGSATTVNNATSGPITVGNASAGEAVGTAVNLSTLLSATTLLAFGTTGTAASAGTTLSTADFTIAYATNNTATGSGGTVQQKAVVNSGLSVMNYAQATQAQQALTAALTQVSAQRAQVGSLIDRLNQSSQDLNTSQLNLTSARGQIMNTDMALAMAKLSQEQVLQQSGVGMLAQANSIPQALLKLIP